MSVLVKKSLITLTNILLDDPENAVSDYDNCLPPSPTTPPENIHHNKPTQWRQMWWIADFLDFPRRSLLAQSELIDLRPNVLRSLTPLCSLSIRGYACGHQRCLVSDSAVGIHFVTSKELSDHIRTDHAADEFPEHKPYRCGLPGCNKSWKVVSLFTLLLARCRSHITSEREWSTISLASVCSLESIDQVVILKICSVGSSKAHFLQAITTFTSTVPSTAHLPAPETSRKQKRPAKTHPCPHANCPQVYKQLSGLRYHLSHVSRYTIWNALECCEHTYLHLGSLS
jgi:hypothetical protein